MLRPLALRLQRIRGAPHGHQTLEHATDRMKQLTRNFAKRQLTWFRADKRVRWMGMKETVDPAGLAAKLIEHVQAG